MFDAAPKFLQFREPMLRRIAGNQRRVDRPDRSANNPIWFNSCLVHRLINAGLICAKCAAALQHKHDLPELGNTLMSPVTISGEAGRIAGALESMILCHRIPSKVICFWESLRRGSFFRRRKGALK